MGGWGVMQSVYRCAQGRGVLCLGECRCFVPAWLRLFCLIINVYTILDIYLQVSITEGLAKLHWVIWLSVLEKINLIYFQGISLLVSRMRRPSKNSNKFRMFLIPRLHKWRHYTKVNSLVHSNSSSIFKSFQKTGIQFS